MPQVRALLGEDITTLPGELSVQWEPGRLLVAFPNGRQQAIRYRIKKDQYIFTSRVATASALNHLEWRELAREILLRNRVTGVVAFRLNGRDGVDAWIEQRASTLQAKELKFYISELAREADHFEYVLTGKDHH